MSGSFRNALAGPQVAPGQPVNRLAMQTPGAMPGNALGPPPGSGPGRPLKPRTSPAFPGDTRHKDPSPAALANAPGAVQQPSAPMLQAPPAMPAPAVTPMPGAAPAGVAGPAPHPADNVDQLRAALASAPIPLSKLAQLAQASDHIIELTGTLLQKAGPITAADLDGALKRAASGGKVDMQAAATFAAQIPPVSNQPALRSALMLQRQRSMQALVALHGASQDRGTPLLQMQNGAAAPPGAASPMSTQAD